MSVTAAPPAGATDRDVTMTRPPLPPFTLETATQKLAWRRTHGTRVTPNVLPGPTPKTAAYFKPDCTSHGAMADKDARANPRRTPWRRAVIQTPTYSVAIALFV